MLICIMSLLVALVAPSAQITIDNYRFSPQSIEVAAGTDVVWVNKDDSLHSVQSKLFASKALDTNESFHYTFTVPGTYTYLCGFHPMMTGQVVVK